MSEKQSKSEEEIMQELLKTQGGNQEDNKEEKTQLDLAIEREKINTNSLLTSSTGTSLNPGEKTEKLGFFYNIYDTFSKKPRSCLALIGIFLAIAFSWYWFFGALYIYWSINDIKNKATYLLEPIEESDFPGLFWAIVLMYFVLGSYVLLHSFSII
ncbi:MAG: hypothetical protein N4A38_01065 [Candidatus Gracilibacteria bacterium]|nr:hypothetical protein [Candidatus Gracilibacteria bacterium]